MKSYIAGNKKASFKKYTAGLCTAALLLGLCGCGKTEMAVPELLEPVGVRRDTAVVCYGDISEVAAYRGRVVPYVEEVFFVADGTLEEISVVCGDTVEKGQQLAILDQEQLQDGIRELEEEISHIQINGEYRDQLAKLQIEIAREEVAILKKSGAAWRVYHAAELEIEKMEAQLRQEQELRAAELDVYKEKLTEKKRELKKGEIRAPFSGEVVYVAECQKGDRVQSYETMVCIADESRLSIVTDYITEYELSQADRLCAVIGGESLEIVPKPFDQTEYVKKVISGAELQSEFLAEKSTENMHSGQFAMVLMYQSSVNNVLQIPVNALYHDAKGEYVYRVTDGQLQRSNVTAGVITQTVAEIKEGLQEGDVVYVKN